MAGVQGFVGYWASGKSLAMCDAIIRRQRLEPSVMVGNNFGYKLGNSFQLNTIDEILAFACTDFGGRSKLIAVDEIGGLLRARGSSTWPPIGDTVFQQGRKLRVELMWTTQHWRLLDVNVRRVTEKVTECKGYFLKRLTPRGVYPIQQRPRLFRLREFDSPNPESCELPQKSDRARWRLFNQKTADSYDTMHLVEAALAALSAQQREARQMEVIREALGVVSMSGGELSDGPSSV